MKKTERAKGLRRTTKEKLAAQPLLIAETDLKGLLHELQVRQVELELRNEDLQRSTQALQEYKTYMQSVINMTPAGYFRLDVDDCFVEINDAWLRMHGYGSRDEIIGKHFSMLQIDSDSNSALRHLEELHNGKPIPLGEFASRRKDGTVGYHVFSAHPVLDTGRIVGFEWFIIDITKRKHAEDELKESEARFRLLVKNAPDAIFVRDKDSFSYLNDAALTLFGAGSAEELLGKPILERYHSTVRDSIRDRMEILNEQGRAVPLYQSICLKLDGSEVNVESSAVPITYVGIDGALVFLRDITDRLEEQTHCQQLEEQLHQSQKIESLGRLAGGVAHDYNNMLSVIIGNAELAQMKAKRSAPLNDNLEHILDAANRSRDITRQLLAFARKQIINPKVLDLNVAVESMLKMLRSLLGENIDLKWQPKEGLWQVKIDPSQLDQVLANLCINARDSITETGKMTIETNTVSLDEDYCKDHPGFISGCYVVLSVTDNGCGMDKETLNKVFEPFFTTKQTGKGTGLGMATVYGIVKQSGGFINVYSEPNQGTTFNIYFPHHEGEDVVSLATTLSDIQMGKGETVLLVEDEIAIVELATAMLEDLGYRVLPTHSPIEALNLLKEFQGDIQLLLTDVVMPGMNGRELEKQVRDKHPKVKSLYMSGYTSDVIAHHGVLDEGINFIQKPFSRHDLSVRIREILDSNT